MVSAISARDRSILFMSLPLISALPYPAFSNILIYLDMLLAAASSRHELARIKIHVPAAHLCHQLPEHSSAHVGL